jgi:transposase-like protein
MVDEKSPTTCPWCASFETVRTAMLVTRAFYFCLACGKGFERRIEATSVTSPAVPPKAQAT